MKNKPAFPQSVAVNDSGDTYCSYEFADGAGLTKREYFAAMAMQGYRSAEVVSTVVPGEIARWSVEDADALIKELEKDGQS